ncbi:MAG: DUF2141 domain-containing protein [Alphaproteobacteria bacterium]|nr:DUF2141 domain-containing protein [Alphaproteobacteria bacterium]MDE2012144.1 DUF2141 domain-containing protein [Alphaproteobacteria bacterium]MDE2072157.1 DUF2141 domain-containing protein [Alphaproteobacteria bacterium]MDE2353147.1 DUF2141 domain-containing protein [Alphaproteobacteria bacterium]
MLAALVLASALSAAAPSGPAAETPAVDTATLTVKVAHVSPKGGKISLALYTAANYEDDDHPTLSRDVPADPAGTTIVISGLKPGVYAVKMMQDINENGKFDTSWLGLPLEPYGFSNNAKPFLSAPSFDSTKFTVAPGDNTITIRLSGTDGISVPKRKEPVK